MDDTVLLLCPAEAAKYLLAQHGRRCSASYLGKLRCVGGGPLFYKRRGMVAYRSADLDGWAKQAPVVGPYSRSSDRTAEVKTAGS